MTGRDAYATAWLSEMWPCVHEVPRHVRAGWAALAADRNERLKESAEEAARLLRKAS